jgi:leucyl-tRNA synthetase
MTVSFNGKARYQKMFAADANNDVIEKATLEDERSTKFLEGKQIVKVIVVPKKIINIVVK